MVGLLRTVTLVAALLLSGCSLFGGVENPIESDAGEAGVSVEVVSCEYDPTTTVARMVYRVTSEKEYATVLINGELGDSSGVVLATSSGSVTGVRSGTTYEQEMVFGLSREPEGDVSCDARFDFASSGIPDIGG